MFLKTTKEWGISILTETRRLRILRSVPHCITSILLDRATVHELVTGNEIDLTQLKRMETGWN
ncbi:MAG: hypothetical protein AUG46_08300 [Acidobacteria bacterium 13_1_20CM_3_58_11]|nr:MAG: hypothetical protein AUG46_08300 [Acidobacteria bacterium 13_1_20CM_3_58_11]